LLQEILQYFRHKDFSYTLTPPALQQDHPIDDFLFRTRQGYCEHYAQALAWMLRAASIPSRVVAGYQGGELNPVGEYFIVRQSQAHAWVEAYFKDQGWTRVDPTRFIDPGRIDPSLAGSIPGSSRSDRPQSGIFAWLEDFQHQAVLAWDGLNHAWNTWLLGYGESQQNALLRKTGLGSDIRRDLGRIILMGLISLLAFLGLLMLILLRPRFQALDPAQASYRAFLKKLEQSGLTRWRAEGPLNFAHRAAKLRPELAEDIRAITQLYVRIRYREEASRELLADLRAKVKRFHPGRRKAPLSKSR
jgi:hypothetical protein